MHRIRTATADDWAEWCGTEIPAYWIGLVYEEADGKGQGIQGQGMQGLGIGAIYEAEDGRWWATMKALAIRPIATYRVARELLNTAAEVDVTVHAMADERVPRAGAFLNWLGFRETDEILNGHKVMVR